MTFVGSIKLQ